MKTCAKWLASSLRVTEQFRSAVPEGVVPKGRFRFARKRGDHFLERGLTSAAKVAAVDACNADDPLAVASMGNDGFVPSSHERFALRNQTGQLAAAARKGARLVASEPLLAVEGEVLSVASSSSLSLRDKGERVQGTVSSVRENRALLRPRTWNVVVETLYLALCDEIEEGKDHARVAKLLSSLRMSYAEMRRTFCAPSFVVLERLMCATALSPNPTEDDLYRAKQLLSDAERYVVTPTRSTYTAFFDVCNSVGAMEVAVQRFADAVERLRIVPDASMVTALVKGLVQHGMLEEALALTSRTSCVVVDVQLFNAVLEALLLSEDAAAVFSAYAALTSRRGHLAVRPTSETIALLLMAVEKTSDYSKLKSVLHDIQRHKVRLSVSSSNLLLKLLSGKGELKAYGEQLFRAMAARRVPVWPELEHQLTGVRTDSKDEPRPGTFLVLNAAALAQQPRERGGVVDLDH